VARHQKHDSGAEENRILLRAGYLELATLYYSCDPDSCFVTVTTLLSVSHTLFVDDPSIVDYRAESSAQIP
jgi:hypothetical protein